MIITRKALPRRTLLRGLGTTLALPLLDAMVPALAAAPVKPIRRLGYVYIPMGAHIKDWTPASPNGPLGELSPILKSLESVRDYVTVVTNTELRNAYPGSEFILGTDPLFRPVNTRIGPDGQIYILDFYHGIIQESQWTPPGSYVRAKIDQYKLDKIITGEALDDVIDPLITEHQAAQLAQRGGRRGAEREHLVGIGRTAVVQVQEARLAVVDEEGIALAAIQGLNQKLEASEKTAREKDLEIQNLKARLEKLEQLINTKINEHK